MKNIPKWATVDPILLGSKIKYNVPNLLAGKWISTSSTFKCIDPLNGSEMVQVSQIGQKQISIVVQQCQKVPKTGLHNPLKKVDRYNMYGEICFKIAQQMKKQEVHNYFRTLVQRVMPKSNQQIDGQLIVTRRFFQNFGFDNPRFVTRGFSVSGDHPGQTSFGYRFPYGNVGIITPFNFPLQIPCLQLFGSLLVGNKTVLKQDSRTAICMEQFIRMAIQCGLPKEDLNLVNCDAKISQQLVKKCNFRMLQFTGSSRVAQRLAQITRGKIRIQDAGFNWKILGPDVKDIQFVSYNSDQDSYAASGQKCSAQSVLFMHQNWKMAGFVQKIKELAERRNLNDLTIGPILTWNNQRIQKHVKSILQIKGAKLQFGGKPIQSRIPKCYGSYSPTAISVPLREFNNNFKLCSTELFGPFQIIVEYKDQQIDQVLSLMQKMQNHLTAGVVSNDPVFLHKVLSNTINGVTYAGIRARTTGAPQNHWFGPAGDPRAAGIGTHQAILSVWTCHRQIINDFIVPSDWKLPKAS